MQNLLFHIDSRGIHGQIVAGWGPQERVRRFVLADDKIAADSWARQQYLAAPGPDFETIVVPVAEAIADLKGWNEDKRTMLIVTSPASARRMLDAGVAVEVISIGNLESGPSKQALSSSVSITPEDGEELRRIIARGVKVVIKALPKDKPEDVAARLGGVSR